MNWYKKAQDIISIISSIANELRAEEVSNYDDDTLKVLCLEVSRVLRDRLIQAGLNAMVVQGTFQLDEPDETFVNYDDHEIEDDELSETFVDYNEESDNMVYTPLHYWVEVDGIIVDITATQFADEVEYDEISPVEIGSYSDFPRYTPLRRGWE
tara:strand:+ start:18389 stop:18850 length:462 start_codon:yes stop_codon:yes gene_type:complete